MFYGQYSGSIDAKNRISVPRGLRDGLAADEIVLTAGFDGALFGFDKQFWEEKSADLLASPLGDEESRITRRTVFSTAFVVKIDDQGRLVVPPKLLASADLEKLPNPIAIIGAGDHFEIWQLQLWEAYAKQLD